MGFVISLIMFFSSIGCVCCGFALHVYFFSSSLFNVRTFQCYIKMFYKAGIYKVS